jgi:hypothetical protein
MIVLSSPELLARVDPRHGAEVIDLVDLRTGRQLLGRPPFASREPVPGDLDEETASYRGGWQLVTPNAGNPCVVNGERHGFHGRASNDPWQVVETGPAHAVLAWQGHGLAVERRLEAAGSELRVTVGFRAEERRVPVVAVEHVTAGLELLDPEVAIELPGGTAYELSEGEGPAETPAAAARWPGVLLLDGSVERADRWPLARKRSRYFVVRDLPEGRAAVRNARSGQALELEWDAGWLGHVWLWHEVRTYGGPWRQRAEILAIEPASVPHGLGLAAAIEHGQARWLEPGERLGYSLVARARS